jgi:lysine 6-dehydrogenase
MSYNYAVLGAGRQGTAAAYDMARWGDARHVILADYDIDIARNAVQRVNAQIGAPVAEPAQVDATDLKALARLLSGVDAFLSAVPYYYNLDITQVAVKVGASMCDLGGHTGIARKQHEFDAQARSAGISVIPNCGQVPGMGTSLMVYAMQMLDEAEHVYMWDGGLPQHPKPPFNYLLTFHIAGLTNEYAEPAVFLRDGVVTQVQPMSELEMVEFPAPIGTLEAFVTGGGTDSMPWTYEGKLRTLQNKTLRFPGHFAQLRAYYDLGLWGLEPIKVNGQQIVPRDVFHALFEPQVVMPQEKDMVVVRVKAEGVKDGRPASAWVEVIDYYDEATRFTAMERGTGWSAAIVAEMAARGETPWGAGGVEVMVPAAAYVEGLRVRGIPVSQRLEI